WAIAHANGFEPRGTVRSFDNKYYSKSAATGPVSLREPYHNEEFSFLQSVAKARLKITITGAYTLAVWSYDEHHTPKDGPLGPGVLAIPREGVASRRRVRDRSLCAVGRGGAPARCRACPGRGRRRRGWGGASARRPAGGAGARLGEGALTGGPVQTADAAVA